MSRNVKSTTAVKKPYCKVCFDAGKPESEYTSHWTRSLPDRSGKTTVTCSTLLNTECRFCFKLGHTTKYCPAIEQNRKEKERADRKERAEVVKKTKPKAQEKEAGKSFAILCCDSDSEDEEKVSITDNFPVLNTASKQPATEEPKQLTGWAAIAAKPVEVKPAPAQNDGLLLLTKNIKYELKQKKEEEVKPKTESKPAPWASKTPVVTKSWADWSDSEDEDQDCEPYQPYTFAVAEEDDDEW
jgi:hypothetical protein